ncbi:hypothetical protein NEP95_23050, partial [Escherichia coli]|nr:hypothetical protein [Escherichia coli]MDI1112184.1 hypothetical protein [Escherichia coli]MDI1187055.1 hypothetical protein [Escherichia coli]
MKFYLSKVQLLHIGMPGDYEPEAGTPNVRVTVYGEHEESITHHMFIKDAKNRKRQRSTVLTLIYWRVLRSMAGVRQLGWKAIPA